jgi:hypothetical protein
VTLPISLPTDNDATYPDTPGDPARKIHQQNHDAVHALYNALVQDDGSGNGEIVAATLAALAALIPLTQKGAPDGVASLDGSGTVPDAQIPATVTRDTELTTAVSNAVTALVNGAPGALDTLNELATALGDDANFAATVTASLAAKAPLASPALTGTPTVNGAQVEDRTHASATFVALSTKVMALVSSLGAKPIMWDFYDRPDTTLAYKDAGQQAPSGHIYTSDGVLTDHAIIVSKEQGWSDETTPGGAFLKLLETKMPVLPTVISKAVVFTDGSTHGHNSVIGCSEAGFSGASGSVQFDIRGGSTWDLFVTDYNGAGGSYQLVYLENDQPLPFTLIQDGKTVYIQTMRWDPLTSSVSLYLDGTLLGTVTDARLSSYWGHKVGSQFRTVLATDGLIRSVGLVVGAPTDTPTTGLPASLVLPGTNDSWVQTTLKQAYIDTPLTDLEVVISAPSLPASGSYNVFMGRWRDVSSEAGACWAVGVNPSGFGAVWLSPDGTTASSVRLTGATALPAGAIWKVTYQASTGDMKWWASYDNEATWTQVGATVTQAGGMTPHPGGREIPLDIGRRDSTSTLQYNGALNYVKLKSGLGGATIAFADFRKQWAGASFMDSTSHLWRLIGTSWAWKLLAAAVPGAAGIGYCSTLGNGVPAYAKTTTLHVATASDAIAAQFTPDRSFTINKLNWFTGGASSGNYDIGIFDDAGTLLWSKGSTAYPAINTSVIETVSPGVAVTQGTRYWVRLTVDNVTATWRGITLGFNDELRQIDGTAWARLNAAAFPLATLAIPGAASATFPHVVLRNA